MKGGVDTISSQHIYWTEWVVLDVDSVWLYLLLQLSLQVSVFGLGGEGGAEAARKQR